MAKRNKITVENVRVSKFMTTESMPKHFTAPCTIWLYFKRTMANGCQYRGVISFSIFAGFECDGASTPWPFSLLVPRWRNGDDLYNAAPVAHDILYIKMGLIPGMDSKSVGMELSREECDDVLRGMWRCWGMSRFVAGCADKGIEALAGGKSHWGNDGYNVRNRVAVRWRYTSL
jgi:hypothetical protein